MHDTIEARPPAPRPRATTALALALALSILAGLFTTQTASAAPAVYGDIGARYAEIGGADLIGQPIDEEHDAFGGGRTQTFEYGIISWHPTIGAHVVYGQIMTEWEQMGREQFGYPTTDELGTPDGVGRFNHFQVPGGEERSIYWTPETGAQAIFGDFRYRWAQDGWETGSLGYPVSREFRPADGSPGVRQNFQHGYLTYDGGTTFHDAETPSVETRQIVVLRCKFADSDAEPYSDQYFREFFGTAGNGKGGFGEYLMDQTYGRVGVEATIRGWYRMPTALADAKPQDRGVRYDECVNAAAAGGYTAPAGSVVVTAVNEQIDGWGGTNAVYLDGVGLFPRFAYHELLHGLGLDHSFSNDLNHKNAPWSAPGEYDDQWDMMSAQDIHSYPTTYFGGGPVGLNAFNRNRLGGMADDDIAFGYGYPGQPGTDYTIESLEQGGTSLPRMLVVHDGARRFTVELRRQDGFSQGIPGDIALIHETTDDKSVLLRDNVTWGKPPLQSVTSDHLRIEVTNVSGDTATVRVTAI